MVARQTRSPGLTLLARTAVSSVSGSAEEDVLPYRSLKGTDLFSAFNLDRSFRKINLSPLISLFNFPQHQQRRAAPSAATGCWAAGDSQKCRVV